MTQVEEQSAELHLDHNGFQDVHNVLKGALPGSLAVSQRVRVHDHHRATKGVQAIEEQQPLELCRLNVLLRKLCQLKRKAVVEDVALCIHAPQVSRILITMHASTGERWPFTAVGEKRCSGAEPGGGEKGRFLGSKPSRADCMAEVPAAACCAARSASACSPQQHLSAP